MQFKLSEIAEKIGARLEGNDLTVTGLSTIDNPKADTLTFISSKKYRKMLPGCICPAVIVPPGEHEIVVSYALNRWWSGVGLSGLGLFIALGLIGWGISRKR